MITYKYCKFLSWPSCGTSWPDKAAFPRSLTSEQSKDHKQPLEKSSSVKRNYSDRINMCEQAAYTLITLLSLLHVTWNHVHGLTSVGSQLCKTLLGSCKLVLRLCKASPVSKHENMQSGTLKFKINMCQIHSNDFFQ